MGIRGFVKNLTGAALTVSKVENIIISLSGSNVILTWDIPNLQSMIILGYGIKRNDSTEEIILTQNTNSDSTTYTDNTTAPETEYEYSVYAIALPISEDTTSDKITTPEGVDLPILNDLIFWLDGADVTTITKDTSDLISQWRDKSAHNYNAMMSIDNPILEENSQNGKPGIRFNGGQGLLTTFGTSKQLGTMFIVAKHDAGSIQTYATLLGGGNTTEVMIANGASSNFYASGGNAYYTASNSNIRKNGVSSNNFTPLGTAHIFSANPETQPTMRTFSKIEIGRGRGSIVGRYWKGAVYEIVIYDKILTEAEREQVENYLSAKWGIVI